MHEHLRIAGLPVDAETDRLRTEEQWHNIRVISFQGADIGMIKLDQHSTPWQILQFQLSRQQQGKGLGERLLRAVLNEANQRGVGVALTVLKANPAQKLYQRLGFIMTGEDEYEYWMQYAPRQNA